MDEGASLQVLLTYFGALRSEIVQRMSIQSAMLGAKITLVSGAIMYVFSSSESGVTGAVVLCLPAVALLFDYLYTGQDLAIRGIRDYLADVLEPELARLTGVRDECLWETCRHMRGEERATFYSTTARRVGNEGLSVFVVGLTLWLAWGQLMTQPWLWGIVLIYALVFADNMYVHCWLMRSHRATETEWDQTQPGS